MSTPDLAALILAYEKALSTDLTKMTPEERARDVERVAAAYQAMIAAAKAAQ